MFAKGVLNRRRLSFLTVSVVVITILAALLWPYR